jgi:multiple sugar transport system substrate-binding protein
MLQGRLRITGTFLRRILCIACLGVLLTGCIDFSFLEPKEPVTIQFATFGDTQYFETLVEEFRQEYDYITVEFVSGRSIFMSSDDPDYDVLLLNHLMLPYFREEFPLIELNPLISEDADFSLDAFFPSTVDALSVEGRRLGIPYMADMLVMYYNKDVFDRRGVPYPTVDWTWNDFLERAQRLSDPSDGEFGFAYHQMGAFGVMEPMVMIYQHGGQLFDDLTEPGAITINEPVNVMALQFYADLIHRHRVAPGPGERRMPFPDRGIEEGAYAMWMGYLSDDWEDLNVGIAPLPTAEQAITFGSVVGFSISSAAEDPEACWAWIKFLTERAPPGLMPARRDIAESDAMVRVLDEDAIAAAQTSLPHLVGLPVNIQGGQFSNTWGAAMQAFNGALTAIQNGDPVGPALDAAQEKVD